MILVILAMMITVSDSEVLLPSNNPAHCRCGEMSTQHPADTIKNMQDLTSTTTTPTPTSTFFKKDDKYLVNIFEAGDIANITIPEKMSISRKSNEPYQPQERPWLVVIRLEKENDEYVECTGSLVSPGVVITSKSCLCFDKFGCDYKKFQKKILNTYIVHSMDYGVGNVTKFNKSTKYPVTSIKQIFSPPKRKDIYKIKSDIALLWLNEPFNFTSKIMPICLPQGNFSEDENLEVFILGFNFHLQRKVPENMKCLAVKGPRMDKCKPFRKRNSTQVVKDCSFQTPYRAIECYQLRKYMNWSTSLPGGLSCVQILLDLAQVEEKERRSRFKGVDKQVISVDCYGEIPGLYGWCGTCLSEAKKGEPGYCGKDMAVEGQPLYEEELARPSEFGGWGFCDKLCSTAKNPSLQKYPVLLEMARMVSTHRDCQKHLCMGLNEHFLNLCLQKVQSARPKTVYRKLADDTFERVKSSSSNTVIDQIPHMATIGDAGSPIFKVINETKEGRGHAVLLGVMSTNQFDPAVDDNQRVREYTKNKNITELITRVQPMMSFIKKVLKKTNQKECYH